jgi:hypothetical protein
VPSHEEETYEGSVRSQVQAPAMNSSRQDLVNMTHIEKLTGDNFPVWKFQMTILLRTKKLLGIVNGTIPRLTCEDEEDWDDKDVACQSIIISAIDGKIMRRLMN